MGKHQLGDVVENEILAAKLNEQRNLTKWNTLHVGRKWYLLTEEVRHILSEAITLGLQPDTQEVRMEVATGRDGKGTGEFHCILVVDALTPLSHKR